MMIQTLGIMRIWKRNDVRNRMLIHPSTMVQPIQMHALFGDDSLSKQYLFSFFLLESVVFLFSIHISWSRRFIVDNIWTPMYRQMFLFFLLYFTCVHIYPTIIISKQMESYQMFSVYLCPYVPRIHWSGRQKVLN